MTKIIRKLRDFPAAYTKQSFIINFCCLALAFIFLSGFSVESAKPPEVQAAQEKLRKSKDSLWEDFAECKINTTADIMNDRYLYGITYTPKVKKLEGKEITISGFMLPLEATEKFKHFLLARRAPTCAFCPPGQPNEIIDVWTDKPVQWDDNIVKVTGKFNFMENKELGVFFQMKDSKIQK